MNVKDLNQIRGKTIDLLRESCTGFKLQGTDKTLTESELLTICWYESVLEFLNKGGAIKDGWLDQNRLVLEQADSFPDTE